MLINPSAVRWSGLSGVKQLLVSGQDQFSLFTSSVTMWQCILLITSVLIIWPGKKLIYLYSVGFPALVKNIKC